MTPEMIKQIFDRWQRKIDADRELNDAYKRAIEVVERFVGLDPNHNQPKDEQANS